MASLFKPVSVKPIPANAVLKTIAGTKFAVWTNRKHKKVTAELTSDGLKCRVESPTWWVEYTGPAGTRERAKGFRDRAATLQLAASLERGAEDIRAGRESPRNADPEHLIDHLPAFEAFLQQKGNGEQHIGYVITNVRFVIKELRLTTPAAVNCDRVANWLRMECQRLDRSPETYNRHVKHLRQFGRWLVKSRKSKLNPFEWLEITSNAAQHREQFRRRLSEDELLRFVRTARESTERVHAMSGPDRARLYLLAAFTGFRMGALSKLTPEAFTWDRKGKLPVSVTISARLSKNKKPHTVPLHKDTAAELVGWLRTCPPGLPLFTSGRWALRGAELVAHDLATARAAWINEAKSSKERTRREASDVLKRINSAGETFDFHALRLQFISSLAIAGVPLSAAQQLADHSTPTLTSNVYTRWQTDEMAAQVDKMPGLKLS